MIEKYTYAELSKEDLYEILRLRTEVFVVEQNCPYQECDNLDQLSMHYLVRKKRSDCSLFKNAPSSK